MFITVHHTFIRRMFTFITHRFFTIPSHLMNVVRSSRSPTNGLTNVMDHLPDSRKRLVVFGHSRNCFRHGHKRGAGCGRATDARIPPPHPHPLIHHRVSAKRLDGRSVHVPVESAKHPPPRFRAPHARGFMASDRKGRQRGVYGRSKA